MEQDFFGGAEVTYLDHMGDDTTVVNAARVSFAKSVDKFGEGDRKLLDYLARNQHHSPFAHTAAQFHFKAPIFVARQLAKHQVGLSWNEVSRRYVDKPPELWWPTKWRKRAANKKQGSSEETVSVGPTTGLFLGGKRPLDCAAVLTIEMYDYYAKALYDAFLEAGVCPEQARMVLPQNMATEWYWSGSLLAWARVWHLRTKPDAQRETAEIVRQIDVPLSRLFPEAWAALKRWQPKMEQVA